MSVEFRVKPEEVLDKTRSIKDSISCIEKELTEISSIIYDTKKYWQGESSQTHQYNFAKIKENIPVIIESLKEHSDELLEMTYINEEIKKHDGNMEQSMSIKPIL